MEGHGPWFWRHCSNTTLSLIINIIYTDTHRHTVHLSVHPLWLVWMVVSVCFAQRCFKYLSQNPNQAEKKPTALVRTCTGPQMHACVSMCDADVQWQLAAGGHLEAAAQGNEGIMCGFVCCHPDFFQHIWSKLSVTENIFSYKTWGSCSSCVLPNRNIVSV